MLKFGSKTDINTSYKCTVRLLDDTEVLECEFQPHHKGSFLLDHVCKQLNVIEKDYFGLRYVDVNKQRHWLDLEKAVLKQVKDIDPILLSFRVKFYPPNPVILQEETTRYQIYLQLKRDLLHGRLYCSQSEAAHLGAYIVQAELGDYDPEVFGLNYVSDMKLLLKQTQGVEEKIEQLHQMQLKGQSSRAMETRFLMKASQLNTYGVDPHPVKDHKGTTLYLGINHLGILTFQGSSKTKHFGWAEIQKINYEGKMFIIHLVYYEESRYGRNKDPDGHGGGRSGRKASSEPATPSTPVGSEPCDANAKDVDGANDYYFRDSFDRSSCDSQLQDTFAKNAPTPSHKSSRSHSPLQSAATCRVRPTAEEGADLSLAASCPAPPPPPDTAPGPGAPVKFNLLQVFVPSFLFVAISLVAATVLILESESEILSNLRQSPEMITLKKYYYQPLKEFFGRGFKNPFYQYKNQI